MLRVIQSTIALLCVVTIPLHANLGEDVAACVKRYGKPIGYSEASDKMPFWHGRFRGWPLHADRVFNQRQGSGCSRIQVGQKRFHGWRVKDDHGGRRRWVSLDADAQRRSGLRQVDPEGQSYRAPRQRKTHADLYVGRNGKSGPPRNDRRQRGEVRPFRIACVRAR